MIIRSLQDNAFGLKLLKNINTGNIERTRLGIFSQWNSKNIALLNYWDNEKNQRYTHSVDKQLVTSKVAFMYHEGPHGFVPILCEKELNNTHTHSTSSIFY